MRWGVRCAETTPTSNRISNSAKAIAAASMVGQSESLPMIRPTCALLTVGIPSVGPNRVRHPVRRALGLLAHHGDIVAEHVDMPDLAIRAFALAVQVHLRLRQSGEEVVQSLVHR